MFFYGKLALSNLRKNRQAYGPFLIAMLFLVAINTMSLIIIDNPGMRKLPNSIAAIMMFQTGLIIILIFSVVFALYTNSFLLKQRKKELGLYNILGLGKRELYQVMIWESFLSLVFVLVTGILTGMLLAKFGFLLLRKLMEVETYFAFSFSFSMLTQVCVIFLIIFSFLLLINCFQVARSNPLDLLQGSKKGEQMPKTQWISAILGLVMLVAGYYLAVTIKSPLAALSIFFIAVVLVIGGTYLLFNAGSIALLKTLKKRNNYYYQTNHFINVSTMIYRMKQNAAGLASICILSTMVLVTVATTACLYFGQKQMVNSRYTYDLEVTIKNQQQAEITKSFQDFLTDKQVAYTNFTELKTSNGLLFTKAGAAKYQPMTKPSTDLSEASDGAMFNLMDGANYQKLAGKPANLKADEVLLLTISGDLPGHTLTLGEQQFKIKDRIKELRGYAPQDGLTDGFLVIFKDWSVIEQLLTSWYQGTEYEKYQQPVYFVGADFKEASNAQQISLANQLAKTLQQKFGPENSLEGYNLDAKLVQAQSSAQFSGGFFFLGLIFGLTFTLATALIIYYKQISEGLDDKERFNILQKVGMSHDEIKRVIHSQVLMVFAFPLVIAFLHLAFAFPVMSKLLVLFGLTNSQLFLSLCVTAGVIFALLYLCVYQLTARSYYKIVERN